jgi:hypothetical protein
VDYFVELEEVVEVTSLAAILGLQEKERQDRVRARIEAAEDARVAAMMHHSYNYGHVDDLGRHAGARWL